MDNVTNFTVFFLKSFLSVMELYNLTYLNMNLTELVFKGVASTNMC